MKKSVMFLLVLFVLLPGCMVLDMGLGRPGEKLISLCRPCPWKIDFVFGIVSGYRPTEKYGKLNERYRNIEINVYNQQIDEYVIIEQHRVYYTIDADERKFMVVEAFVPEHIKNITSGELEYYVSYIFDGYDNNSQLYKVPIKEIPCQ